MELQKVKGFLNLKGVMQDGLFAFGSISKKSTRDFGNALGAVYGGSIASLYAFTFFEGALAITPITEKEVLIDELIRIKKFDVSKIILKRKFFGVLLQIIFKDNKEKFYNLKKAGDIKEIIKRVIS